MEIRGIDTMNGAEVNDVFFTDCEVPADAVIGEVDQGWYQLMAGLDTNGSSSAAQMLGTADGPSTTPRVRHRAFAVRQSRRVFQAMKHRIADLATEIECRGCSCTALPSRRTRPSRARTSPGCRPWPSSKRPRWPRPPRLEGMQMMGGYGYSIRVPDDPASQRRPGATIYGGTNEIQREIIGRSYGL